MNNINFRLLSLFVVVTVVFMSHVIYAGGSGGGYGGSSTGASGEGSNNGFGGDGFGGSMTDGGGGFGSGFGGTTFAPAPVADITCSKDSVDEGESLILTWSCTNAANITSEHFNADNNMSGAISVSPVVDTTYKIICSNESTTNTNTNGFGGGFGGGGQADWGGGFGGFGDGSSSVGF